MKLVQIGKIGRPHGYRGAFVLATASTSEPFSTPFSTVYIGAKPDTASPHKVLDFTPMPKGLRLTLDGFASDTLVKEKRGEPVFVDRAELPTPKTDEYFVEDLIGSDVLALETESSLGLLSAVEEVAPGCPDRWWVKTPTDSFAIPATAQYIVRVDPIARQIWVRDGQQFQ